jgi:hypothetical protein
MFGVIDPETGLARNGSYNSGFGRNESTNSRTSFAGSGRYVGGVAVKPDPDIEDAIQRWGSLRSVSQRASQARKSTNLGRFGSQSSVSVLDVIAAGGDIQMLPFYDILVKNLTYKVCFYSR